MANPSEALTVQMLEWIGAHRRAYAEVLEVWRTSCPRLSIWEDACIDGLIDMDRTGKFVMLSEKGRYLLESSSAQTAIVAES